MRKLQLIVTLLLLIIPNIYSQKITVLQDKVLSSTPGKELNSFNRLVGMKNPYPGTGQIPGEYLSFADMGEAGFLYRNKFTVTMYNNNLEKRWEKVVKNELGYADQPHIVMASSQNEAYLIETCKKKKRIIKFYPDGKEIDIIYKNEENLDDHGYISYNGELIFLVSKFVKKEYVRHFFILKFNKDMVQELIPTDLTDNNNDKFPNESNTWCLVFGKQNNLVLRKLISKELSNKKDDLEWILQSVELSLEGKMQSTTNYKFENKNPSSWDFQDDIDRNCFYIFGDDNQNGVGLFVNKYMFGIPTPEYSKIITRKEIIDKTKDSATLKENTSYYIGEYFVNFIIGEFEQENNYLNLKLYANRESYQKTTYEKIKLDEKGNIIKIEEDITLNIPNMFHNSYPAQLYRGNISTFSDFTLWPVQSTAIYTTPGVKTSVYDYISTEGPKIETNGLFSNIYRRSDHYMLVYITDKNCELRAIKLKVE